MARLSEFEGGRLLPVRSQLVLSSTSITVVDEGWAIVAGMGGGAGGNRSYGPGNSAPWGVKAFSVAAGDVIGFVIGAGGQARTTENLPSAPGGNTLITVNGNVLMTCQGGDAGPNTAQGVSPVTAAIMGADYWTKGRQPQGNLSYGNLAGAAVDVGNGTSGNGSTGDHAVDLYGTLVGVPIGSYFWPFDISFHGGQPGAPGVGSSVGSSPPAGLFGGGSGHSDGSTHTLPGRGASAGRTGYNIMPRNGGAGLAHLRLFKRV
jgi:hypothetical protein